MKINKYNNLPLPKRGRRIHFTGIGGVGMCGIAEVMHRIGYAISGSDLHSGKMTQHLADLGIKIQIGHAAEHVHGCDVVVISSAVKEDNPEVQAARSKRIPVIPRAEMLGELMRFRQGIAIAGTHGKTTTSSMLAWILEQAGLEPGFLIGGVPENFGVSARLGNGKFFVVEADEYDSAYFDKRSKFIHYHPKTLVLNNLEYDHADIFPDLAAIQLQFHYLVRTVPSSGLIIHNKQNVAIDNTLEKGCWTPLKSFVDGDWAAKSLSADNSSFEVHYQQQMVPVKWDLIGQHNVDNALAAIA
ncbi:Mur ligase domain-containing protein, partial [Thiotrichales bacterium HSG1]|nr:Mur ligase domain-containing protein [Thiotrichales bacterium HSG1]